jgi:hypothetical protein
MKSKINEQMKSKKKKNNKMKSKLSGCITAGTTLETMAENFGLKRRLDILKKNGKSLEKDQRRRQYVRFI